MGLTHLFGRSVVLFYVIVKVSRSQTTKFKNSTCVNNSIYNEITVFLTTGLTKCYEKELVSCSGLVQLS